MLSQHAVVGLEGVSVRATLAGVATARRGRASMTKEARRENILVEGASNLSKLFAEDLSLYSACSYTCRDRTTYLRMSMDATREDHLVKRRVVEPISNYSTI